MKRSLCGQLDDYMLGWLTPAEADAFESHLPDCADCHRQHALQQSIDALLAETAGSLDAIPSDLVENARHRVRLARRRKAVAWATGIAAAAAILISAFVARSGSWRSARSVDRDVATLQHPDAPASAISNLPSGKSEKLQASSRVAMADPSSAIVVECKTSDPRIKLVWVYPTVKRKAATPVEKSTQ
jgi:anti-sigma factor RsiW